MSNKPQEINFFKGVVSHPNPISAAPGTFRDIKNGWHLRDGIVDKRPGFSINTSQTKAPGFLSQFNGLIGQNDFTFLRQYSSLGNYVPGTGYFPFTGGDTTDCYKVTAVATSGSGNARLLSVGPVPMVAIAKHLDSNAIKTQPFISVYSAVDGQLLFQYADTGTSTQPQVEGMCFGSLESGFGLFFGRVDTNKIYFMTISTPTTSPGLGSVTAVAGSGSAGLGTGNNLGTVNIGPIRGITAYWDTNNSHAHLYACVSNGILDLDFDDGANGSSTLIAGSTSSGYTDATGASARFNTPWGIDYFSDAHDTLFVADSANNSIRQVVVSTGVVTTLAGSTSGTAGNTNGVGTAARFSAPKGLSCLVPVSGSDLSEFMVIADSANYRLRNCDTLGTVGTFAGSSNGYQDGASAKFTDIDGVAVLQDLTPNGISPALSSSVKFFVADTGISRLRCVDYGEAESSNDVWTVTSTWAGSGNGITGSNYYQSNNRLGYAGGIFNCPTSQSEYGFSAFEANGTTYFNTARGVLAADLSSSYSNSNVIRYAGAPTGLDLTLTLVGSPGTLLPADYNVGYRIVWGYKTASGTAIQGTPSSEAVIDNPSGAGSTQDVQVKSNIPPGVDSTWTYQIYRTLVNFQDTPSGTPVSPGDTEFLVYESSPTSTDLLNGYIQITDNTPDSQVGAALYTNATQETASQANAQPPICMDMCVFNGMAIYANTTQAQQMQVNLVGTSTFVNGHTISFAFANTAFNFSLTANDTTETISTGTFKFYTSGSSAANVQNTAQSICRVLNGYLSNRQIRAYYTSPYNANPGQITLVGALIGSPQWSITCTAADSAMFSPTIPSSGTTYSSLAETRSNGIYISKVGQPDAVPLVNNEIVGSSSDAIRRVLPLRTSCIIIKERSIWRLTGTTPQNVVVSLLDNTTSLRSDHSVSLLNNEVYALTTQGVVAISDNGVRIVSRDIEFELTQVTGSLQSPLDLANCCWGYGSDDSRIYFLSIFQTSAQAVTWCYSPFANAWARWDLIVYALTVTDGQIIAQCVSDINATSTSKTLNPYVVYQKDIPPIQLANCYADDGTTATITSISGNVVHSDYYNNKKPIGWYSGAVSSNGLKSPGVGWVIFAHNRYYYVISADSNANVAMTLNHVTGLAVNDVVTFYRPIDFYLRLNPITAGETFQGKQWSDFFVAIESKNAYQFSTGFLLSTQPEGTTFNAPPNVVLSQLQGTGSGVDPDDASLYLEQVQRMTIPKAAAWGNALEVIFEHKEAFSELVLKAVSMETRGIPTTKVQQ